MKFRNKRTGETKEFTEVDLSNAETSSQAEMNVGSTEAGDTVFICRKCNKPEKVSGNVVQQALKQLTEKR